MIPNAASPLPSSVAADSPESSSSFSVCIEAAGAAASAPGQSQTSPELDTADVSASAQQAGDRFKEGLFDLFHQPDIKRLISFGLRKTFNLNMGEWLAYSNLSTLAKTKFDLYFINHVKGREKATQAAA